MPKLSLENDANSFAYQPLPPLICSGEQLFTVHDTALHINETVLNNRVIDRCEYRAIHWQSDSYATYSRSRVQETDPFELKIKHDFFKVECYLHKKDEKHDKQHTVVNSVIENKDVKVRNDRSAEKPIADQRGEQLEVVNDKEEVVADEKNKKDETYEDYNYIATEELPDFEQFIAQIYPTNEILDRVQNIKPQKNSLQMNVLILIVDSMSHLSYQRKLPKTYAYLKSSLDTFILNGYNIVGDATTAAMIPLLTGKKHF